MAGDKTPKISPCSKTIKKATPNSKKPTPKKLFTSPINSEDQTCLPSPRSMRIVYDQLELENTKLKKEVELLLSRLIESWDYVAVDSYLLGSKPLPKVYSIFRGMDEDPEKTGGQDTGEDEGSSKPQPVVIVIPDSSAD